MSSKLSDPFGDSNFWRLLSKRIEERWSFEKIEPMSTAEIFTRLNQLGIEVSPEDYRMAARRHDSAERLADEWYAQYPLRPQGPYDEDFVWMAAIVLWKRLIPDRVCFEQIDEAMQEGYKLLEMHRTTDACGVWWQVWKWLKEKVTPERNTLEALDRDFRGTQAVYNWCQDFEMELGNAGLDEPEYYRLRIEYCQEFLETFADIEWQMRGNFLVAEAESYWRLGEIKTAEARFKALIEANPDWGWGYIGWSDVYWLFHDSPKDYDRAERILQRALDRPGLEDREDVLNRLKSLRAERAQARSRRRKKKRRKR